jgi:Protein of unknown function (DUF2523)
MQPLIAKIMVSLGLSVVSIVGLQAALSGLKSQFVGSINSLPADAVSLFLIGGGGISLGILFGAMTTRLLLWQIQSATKILGVNT